MVKGISRRVVVVRPESGGPFEQAIFLVCDLAFPRGDAVRDVQVGFLAIDHHGRIGAFALQPGFTFAATDLAGRTQVQAAQSLNKPATTK